MDLITQEDFDKVASQDVYYNGRWVYYEQVLEILRTLQFSSALELGPYKLPLVAGVCMDLFPQFPNTIKHDAKQTPWPITAKEFDLFIALQVWEHLGDKQAEAFAEVKRISRRAVLSFPFEWNCPDNPIHHQIDSDTIRKWTLNTEPTTTVLVRCSALLVRPRLICVYDFKGDS